MTEGVFLHGVALANYRGIGSEPVLIGPFSRFNFFIGPNNAGKSTVLGFIARHLSYFVCRDTRFSSEESKAIISPLDIHLGATLNQVRMGIAVPISALRQRIFDSREPLATRRGVGELLEKILSHLSVGDLIWVERQLGARSMSTLSEMNPTSMQGLASPNVWESLWMILRQQSGGSILAHWIPESLNFILGQIQMELPKINLIPAIREISLKGEEFKDWTGVGLIEELARLQNPDHHERQRLLKFNRINTFLKAVTQEPTATIEVPHHRDHVLVHMDGKVLPLESLGTGIHEVVMIAAFCTLAEKEIVCIEEPEIHLHPLLQRRLIRYLEEQTDNQYFIATHSASIIDTPGAAIFHVTNRDGATRVEPAGSAAARFEVCRDLGYKASDLLQANAILWVEGPSDRIYVRHWIAALAPELREGIEYSVMFYGGRLLSHLAVDDPELAEPDIHALIAVRQLNRNLAVLIDSDKAHRDAPINSTKRRIVAEFEGQPGVVWVTAGREIENYITSDTMGDAIAEVYPTKFNGRIKKGQYDHVLPFRARDGLLCKIVDKVAVAHKVCNRPADLDVLDLRERIASLIELIRRANRF